MHDLLIFFESNGSGIIKIKYEYIFYFVLFLFKFLDIWFKKIIIVKMIKI